MKVTAVLHSAPPHRTVGGEMMTLRLMDNLNSRGHEAVVTARSFSTTSRWGSVPVLPGNVAGELSSLAAVNAADVIVTHPELLPWLGRITRATMRKPVVTIVHNLEEWTLRNLRAYQRAHVVANSNNTADELSTLGVLSREDITVVYPPVVETPAPVLGLPRSFVTLVNLSEDKGGNVFHELAGRLPEIPFAGVYGGHGEQRYLSDTDPVPDNVTLFRHGPLGLPLNMTRVLLAPSKTETYNMVSCEASLLQIPVLASDLPAHRESLGDSAVLLPVDDVDSWENALRDVWYDANHYDELLHRVSMHSSVLRDRLSSTYDAWEALLMSIA